MFTDDVEVRTRSVPAAGHLICLGFEPLRVIAKPDGTKTVVFSPAARSAMAAYLAAKTRVDAMLDAVEPAR